MPTRTATRTVDPGLDLDQYSNEELDSLLFSEAPREANPSKTNIPLVMGIATAAVTLFYILGEIGTGLLNLVGLEGMVPWDMTGLVPITLLAASALILVTGLGGRRTGRKRKEKVSLRKQSDGRRVTSTEKRKLVKSRENKKIAGVAAGIADYFGWDPTLVRAAFVVGGFVTQGAAVLLYVILAAVLPKAEPLSLEERLRVIRDS